MEIKTTVITTKDLICVDHQQPILEPWPAALVAQPATCQVQCSFMFHSEV